ncbi:sulfuric ester hydrolase [Aureococcus anophagefferens]|uniref:Sulfuric ester hydrolase n=1 Tax=Aureococcus anophagefferens TaxID=44056 RepID=A0ABR1FHY3_AURAN
MGSRVAPLLLLLTSTAATTKPHLIFLLADDEGWNNGFYNEDVLTPHTDALVAAGVKLTNHYVYKFCSPTRSSFLSGRLPIHVNQENSATEQAGAGVPLGMSTIGETMRAAGYRTAHVGKWHCGMATPAHTPYGRGFDSSIGFFNFGEDHYTQVRGGQALVEDGASARCSGVDLWRDGAPARGENGTYGGYTFTRAAVAAVEANATKPLFLFAAFQNLHPPLEVPPEYVARYANETLRTTINGMAAFLDDSVGNVTQALKKQNMYDSSLIVYTPDNGGYLTQGGDDAPFRGGKFSDFQGGVRVAAFISGGLVPAGLRGTASAALVHVCDWMATFAALGGGAIPADAVAGLPAPDSLDVWPALSRGRPSPRTEVPLSILPADGAARAFVDFDGVGYFVGGEGLLVGDMKLLLGYQHIGPFDKVTNATCAGVAGPWAAGRPGVPCDCATTGCLYNVTADPTESDDLAAARPGAVAALRSRLEALRATVYAPDRGAKDDAACAQIATNGGFWGPWR